MPQITIFTPTYNRALTLPRVYHSLCEQQGEVEIEWLVVDDGSTDATRALIAEYKIQASFPIIYIYQPNGGKHRAHNTALAHLRGELCVILDSDDELTNNALSSIWGKWSALELQQKSRLSGVIGHSSNSEGQLVGLPYPSDDMVGSTFYLALVGAMVGEKLPCYRSDLLKHYPFPEKKSCSLHVVEGIVWTRLTEDFPVLCLNSVVRIYHRDSKDSESLMNKIMSGGGANWASFDYSVYLMSLSKKYFLKFPLMCLKIAVGFHLNAIKAGISLSEQRSRILGAYELLLWLIALLPCRLLFLMKLLR